MKIYYRISDNSYAKEKIPGTTKEVCLDNLISVFGKKRLKIIADRCEPDTLEMLNQKCDDVVITSYGNAGSFLHAVDLAIEECDDYELVYFCEDDYLHLEKAPDVLAEGLKVADYVTLYDHPDKYSPMYNGGEVSKVVRTKLTHWRYTISTCMTFGTTVSKLKEDYEIWKEFTSAQHPHDHSAFSKLKKDKNRSLAVCIPGTACHTDLTVSKQFGTILVDDWAIDTMIQYFEEQLFYENVEQGLAIEKMLEKKTGWSLLNTLSFLCRNQ